MFIPVNLSKYLRLSGGLGALLKGIDANDHCSWCHYLSCVPTSKWNCHTEAAYCLVSVLAESFLVWKILSDPMNELIYQLFSSIVTLYSLKNIPHLTLREHCFKAYDYVSANDIPKNIITWKTTQQIYSIETCYSQD